MAKKQKTIKKKLVAPKRGASKKAKAPKQSKREAEKVLRTGPIRRAPKNTPLPGMEGIGQIAVLDNCCRRISEIRAEKNDLVADEAAEEQVALNALRKHNRTSYRQHGVELVRVPGEEKLRVRTSKGGATAETEEPEPADLDPMDVEEGTSGIGADEQGVPF